MWVWAWARLLPSSLWSSGFGVVANDRATRRSRIIPSKIIPSIHMPNSSRIMEKSILEMDIMVAWTTLQIQWQGNSSRTSVLSNCRTRMLYMKWEAMVHRSCLRKSHLGEEPKISRSIVVIFSGVQFESVSIPGLSFDLTPPTSRA